MSISVSCDLCGKILKARDELAGKKVKCPGCGVALSIPRSSDEADFEEEIDDYEPEPAPVRKKGSSGSRKGGKRGRSQASLVVRTAVLSSLLGVLGIVLFLMAWGRFGAPAAPSVAQQPNPPAGGQSAPTATLPVVPVEQLTWRPIRMNRDLISLELPGEPDQGTIDQSLNQGILQEMRVHNVIANGGTAQIVAGFGTKIVRDFEEHKQVINQFEQQFLQTHPGTTIQIQNDQLVQGMAARKTTFAAGGRIVGWQQMVWTGSQFILLRIAQSGNADFSAAQQRVLDSFRFTPRSTDALPAGGPPVVAATSRPGTDPAPPVVRDPLAFPWTSCPDERRLFEVQGPGVPGRIVRELARTIEKFVWRVGNPDSPTYLTFAVMRWNPGEVRDRAALLAYARKHSEDFRESYVKLVKPTRFDRTETEWQGYPAFETYTFNERGMQIHEFLVYTMDCQVKLELVWNTGEEQKDLWQRFTGSLKALK